MTAKRGGGLVADAFKLGLGSALAYMLLIAIAAALFIPGFILVWRENKKPKDKRRQALKITGYVLMAIGMIAGLGFGANAFFLSLGADIMSN